jgi:hypothetical protein
MKPDSLSEISIVIGLVGIGLAVLFYLKSRRIKRLSYSLWSFTLLRDFKAQIEDLSISYGERQIPSLTVTKVALWNSGNVTIQRSDIATADQLRIAAREGCKILDVAVLHAPNPANLFDVTRQGCRVLINFDFLDSREGGVVQVLHSGKSSADVAITGSIKGAGRPIGSKIDERFLSYPIIIDVMWAGLMLGMSFLVGWNILTSHTSGMVKFLILLTGVPFFWLGAFLPSYGNLSAWSSMPPRKFDPFYESI